MKKQKFLFAIMTSLLAVSMTLSGTLGIVAKAAGAGDSGIKPYSVYNTDPENADWVTVNSLQYDMISEEGQERWYYFQTEAGKLTLDLKAPYSGDVDYSISLYSYNSAEANPYVLVAKAQTKGTAKEHIARQVDAGIYYVEVEGVSGYDEVNSFQLGIGYTAVYEAPEIDDDFRTPNAVTVPFSITGTMDNPYDHDYIKFTVSEEATVLFSLSDNSSSGSNYRVDIYNGSGKYLDYMNQGEGTMSFTPGNYYACISATKYSGAGASYAFSGTYKEGGDSGNTGDPKDPDEPEDPDEGTTAVSKVNITKAGDAFIDYDGRGPFWRIHTSQTITGTAYDASGNPVPDANIEIQIVVEDGTITRKASGTTDSNGNFSIYIYVGDGSSWHYRYDTGFSYHYYNIVPINFYSNGTKVNANITKLYHLVDQEYHGGL